MFIFNLKAIFFIYFRRYFMLGLSSRSSCNKKYLL